METPGWPMAQGVGFRPSATKMRRSATALLYQRSGVRGVIAIWGEPVISCRTNSYNRTGALPFRSMKTLAVATGNKHKLQEFSEILAPLGWRVASIRDWLPSVPEPEETEPDFVGNAALKCRFAVAALRAVDLGSLPDAVAADDSGLAVNILDGAPGVYSARFAEMAGAGTGDAANRSELVRRLGHVGMKPGDTTAAAFACAIHFQDLSGADHHSALAFCEGRVGIEERGAGGFGYDSLFFPVLQDESVSDRTFAELPSEAKHALSHRGKALRILAAELSA